MPNSSLLSMLDPGVQFICGLSDVSAIINETAELTCKLDSEDCEGAWFRDGKKVSRMGQTHHFPGHCVHQCRGLWSFWFIWSEGEKKNKNNIYWS